MSSQTQYLPINKICGLCSKGGLIPFSKQPGPKQIPVSGPKLHDRTMAPSSVPTQTIMVLLCST